MIDQKFLNPEVVDVKCFVRNGASKRERTLLDVISCGERNKSESKLKVPLTR